MSEGNNPELGRDGNLGFRQGFVGSNPTPGAYDKPTLLRWQPTVSISSLKFADSLEDNF